LSFESEIKKGNFVVTECTLCNKIMWPYSEFCNNCFNRTTIRNAKKEGKILEYSKHQEKYFAMAEFEGIMRLFGEIIAGIPASGKTVRLEECGIKNGSYFFKMSIKN